MTRLQWWLLLAAEFSFILMSGCQLSPQKRRCVFHLNNTANTQQDHRYYMAGNVSGSEQVCENTHCCVGYFLVMDNRSVVDLLACDVAEKRCPEATCRRQTRLNMMKCVCNTDLCNGNLSWTPQLEEAPLTQPPVLDEILKVTVILIGSALVLILIIVASNWKKVRHETLQVLECGASPTCSCQTTRSTDINTSAVQLLQVLGRGSSGTVWQGTFGGSTVAVKVFPAAHRHTFVRERQVYQLPLMNHHDGILHFLGAGWNQEDGSWRMLLQFAEQGSLHSFLCQHSSSWTRSLKMCQSLSQGLSYLHSDLHSYAEHKPPVAHRDLSSFNVLVNADGSCSLCDFGSSIILSSCSAQHDNNMVYRQLGTVRNMAPEVLQGAVNIKGRWCLMQADVYGLALLLWQIWMRCSDLFEGGAAPPHLLPYEAELDGDVTLKSLVEFVCVLGKRPSVPKHWEQLPQGSELLELLSDCWDCDPDARLTAHCVVNRLVSLQNCVSL